MISPVIQGVVKNICANMCESLLYICISQRNEDGKAKLTDLPDDCLREILLRFPDHQDVISTSLTNQRAFDLAQETKVWKDLCVFHFPTHKWPAVVRKGEELGSLDWNTLYLRLERLVPLQYMHSYNCSARGSIDAHIGKCKGGHYRLIYMCSNFYQRLSVGAHYTCQ